MFFFFLLFLKLKPARRVFCTFVPFQCPFFCRFCFVVISVRLYTVKTSFGVSDSTRLEHVVGNGTIKVVAPSGNTDGSPLVESGRRSLGVHASAAQLGKPELFQTHKVGLTLVDFTITTSVFRAQRKSKRNGPLVVGTSSSNPLGGWMILVGAPIRLPLTRIARNDTRNLKHTGLIHVPRRVQ
jgi:hypothetical protein